MIEPLPEVQRLMRRVCGLNLHWLPVGRAVIGLAVVLRREKQKCPGIRGLRIGFASKTIRQKRTPTVPQPPAKRTVHRAAKLTLRSVEIPCGKAPRWSDCSCGLAHRIAGLIPSVRGDWPLRWM